MRQAGRRTRPEKREKTSLWEVSTKDATAEDNASRVALWPVAWGSVNAVERNRPYVDMGRKSNLQFRLEDCTVVVVGSLGD